jgi:hypothetical protein
MSISTLCDMLNGGIRVVPTTGGADTAQALKFAAINLTTATTTVVQAIPDKKIRVLAVAMSAAGSVIARFVSGTGSVALSGPINMQWGIALTLPLISTGWCETAAGSALQINTNNGMVVGGMLVYTEV